MISIQIFVGSPNNVGHFRTAILDLIKELRSDLEDDDINIVGKDWHKVIGTLGSPQALINPEIVRSDIVIIIIGHRVGEGTLNEVELSKNLQINGELSTVMLYFQKIPFEQMKAPSADLQQVIELRKKIEGLMLYHEFIEEKDLIKLARTHLNRWIAPVRHLHRFKKIYGNTLDPVLTKAINVPDPPSFDETILLETIPWDKNLPDGKDVYDYRRYIESRDGRPFDIDMLGCYRVARFLYRQVIDDKTHFFSDKPFTNYIHRYLSYHIRQEKQQNIPLSTLYLQNLHKWLGSRSNNYGHTRSFAAYQIGMCRDQGGRDLLLSTVKDPYESENVRYYAAIALGMIRIRDVIMPLIEIHDQEGIPISFKKAVGHSILAVAGLLPSCG